MYISRVDNTSKRIAYKQKNYNNYNVLRFAPYGRTTHEKKPRKKKKTRREKEKRKKYLISEYFLNTN